jgi:glycosyltransferase involved in cell wall biosynthesis
MNSLYICYFGIDQPLVQTQVLPYLRLLASGGGPVSDTPEIKVTLLTFEPLVGVETRERFMEIRDALSAEGIAWEYLRYHKTPSVPATAYDILVGALFVRKLIASKSIDLIHARVHVPCLMGVIGRKLSLRKTPELLFDIRGFFPEEYVDAGLWKRGGILFRIAKKIEKWLFRSSEGFVVLTEKAKDVIADSIAGKPVEVIPCCVDFDRFSRVSEAEVQTTRREIGNNGRLTATYIGSFGGWYLTEETIEAFKSLRALRPDAFALILTQSEPRPIESRLLGAGYTPADFKVMKVAPCDVPRYLACADIAISFIMPSFSKIASSPTKNAEYLASGLPILANVGIGDTTEQLSEDHTGILVDELSDGGIRVGVQRIIELVESVPELEQRCKESAERRFSLGGIGAPSYRRIYNRIMRNRIS